jgi:DNA polymerase IV
VEPRTERWIIHVDMDAFYAAVEQRDDPSLRGKPVIVGGKSPRSVVSTASYEARRFGVRSAMPMVEAVRRCPPGIIVEPRHDVYAKVSEEVMAILTTYSPLCEPLSLDEAFLDVTGSRALFGEAPAIASTIRQRIRAELDLTASAGVATSKFVAKIASDLHKPDGLTVVPSGEEASFLEPLPVERMWGVGPKATARLHAQGLRTIGDLARSPAARLHRVLGTSWGAEIVALARGEDTRDVSPSRDAKSIGGEETFERDLATREELEPHLLAQAERVAQRLAGEGLLCRTLTLKVKFADHASVTRRTTLTSAVCDTTTIYAAARALLDKVELTRSVRLIGVQASSLEAEEREQRGLFHDAREDRRRALEKTLHGVRERYGGDSLFHARIAEARARRPRGPR